VLTVEASDQLAGVKIGKRNDLDFANPKASSTAGATLRSSASNTHPRMTGVNSMAV
jgi:hypothetical protein